MPTGTIPRRPLPPARVGADQKYKEFKLVAYYDQDQSHRDVSVTRGDHHVAGRLMRRQAARIALDKAREKIALADGAVVGRIGDTVVLPLRVTAPTPLIETCVAPVVVQLSVDC